jgi:hypothetical protein
MKITESYIKKVIQEELKNLIENNSFNLSPEDKGVLMAVGQALEKAIDTVSRYTNIDDENETTHEGVVAIQSMLAEAAMLQQKLLNGGSFDSPDEDESTEVIDDDLRLISFALRPGATDEERKVASEKLDQIIGQSPLQERKINEVKGDVAQALGRISTFIKNSPIDIGQRNELSGDLIAVMEKMISLERSLGSRGKEIGYVVPGTSPSNKIAGDQERRIRTTAENKNNE